MADVPEGLSGEEDNLLYIIRRKDGASINRISLSLEEAYGLIETLDTWRNRRLSQLQPQSGTARAVMFQPASEARAALDANSQHVLLSVAFEDGSGRDYGLSLQAAERLLMELQTAIAKGHETLTRQ